MAAGNPFTWNVYDQNKHVPQLAQAFDTEMVRVECQENMTIFRVKQKLPRHHLMQQETPNQEVLAELVTQALVLIQSKVLEKLEIYIALDPNSSTALVTYRLALGGDGQLRIEEK